MDRNPDFAKEIFVVSAHGDPRKTVRFTICPTCGVVLMAEHDRALAQHLIWHVEHGDIS